jgi:mRNA-degrading endonuclease RelE of RelBE toxin-antitoxin system
MTWLVDWTPPGRVALERLPWTDAARIDEAVERFAKTGEGDFYRLPEDDAVTLRLRIGSYRVRLTRDARERVLRVWWVYRV